MKYYSHSKNRRHAHTLLIRTQKRLGLNLFYNSRFTYQNASIELVKEIHDEKKFHKSPCAKSQTYAQMPEKLKIRNKSCMKKQLIDIIRLV